MLRLVVANLFGLLVLLVLFEVSIRWMYPEITPLGTDARLVQDSVYGSTPGLRASATGRSNGALFEIDSNGYVAYRRNAPSEAHAWLFLGDSVTMGIGVEPDSTFAGRIAASSPLYVLNPSLIGYDAADYLTLLDHHLKRNNSRSIARVTLFWCLNDLYLPGTGETSPGTPLRRGIGPALGFVQRHVHAYQWLKRTFADRPKAYFEHDNRLYGTAAVDTSIERIARMQAMAAEHDLPFFVVLLPYAYQFRAATPDAFRPQQVLGKRLAEKGIDVLDPAPFLASRRGDPADLYGYGDGIHFSSDGHAAIAEFLQQHP